MGTAEKTVRIFISDFTIVQLAEMEAQWKLLEPSEKAATKAKVIINRNLNNPSLGNQVQIEI